MTRTGMVDPTVPPPIETRTLADLVPLIIALCMFGLLGGGTRMLVRWNASEGWQRRLGGALGSLVATLVVGLPLAEIPWFHDRIGVLLSCGALASWGGSQLIDVLTRRLEGVADRYMRDRGL